MLILSGFFTHFYVKYPDLSSFCSILEYALFYYERAFMYHGALYLQHYIHSAQVIHYLSFRCIAALLTALFLSFLLGNWFIGTAKRLFRAKSREYTPENHRNKDDMPTMGGLFIVGIVILSTVIWANWTKPEIWVFLFCLIIFGAIGIWDDWSKIAQRKGISEKVKFRAQVGAAVIISCLWYFWCNPVTTVCVPFFKNYTPDLGWLIIPWAVFLLVATSNAVNLTDGLDGLAIGSLVTNFVTFSLIAYLAGHAAFAGYLHIPFAHTAELTIIGAALVGSSLGFLWYNTYPAQIFMGDVGSLALGAGLALLALMTRQELLLAITGGLFMIETLSVIVQVFTYKRWKKRIFKMAPLHHHFELLGWQESKITVRFAIITLILCLIALLTLKIR